MRGSRTTGRTELLPGTLEMLILKTLSIEPMHGYGIAQHIQMLSADVLTVEEGSLYPALQRMLVKGWVSAEWKISANNRRARFYRLTTAGKKQLGVEEARFAELFGAIMRVMKTA
jgi:transcriptional regulator